MTEHIPIYITPEGERRIKAGDLVDAMDTDYTIRCIIEDIQENFYDLEEFGDVTINLDEPENTLLNETHCHWLVTNLLTHRDRQITRRLLFTFGPKNPKFYYATPDML